MRRSSCRPLAVASNLVKRDHQTAAASFRRRVRGTRGLLLVTAPRRLAQEQQQQQQQNHEERSARTLGVVFPRAAALLAAQHGAPLPRQQIRGKKSTTSIDLADLPQGPIRPAPGPPTPSLGDGQQQQQQQRQQQDDDDGPAYPTVVLQARRNMARFENCVLLTRVGGFYELYFEHAEEYGPLLNLKVAQKKTNAGPVPMVALNPPRNKTYCSRPMEI
jgi:hypothetical protein